MPAWSVVYDGFDATQEKLRETLCTVGDGYFATRGSAPEAVADTVHYPGTCAAGCYNALTDTVAGREVVNESAVRLPDWLATRLRFDDGPWFDAAAEELTTTSGHSTCAAALSPANRPSAIRPDAPPGYPSGGSRTWSSRTSARCRRP